MFRKIVSGLPYSPALVGQLGFYARRLRKEEATRRLGLLFTALALVMQSFAVFSPPEPANAASDSDFIRGGISSLNDVIAAYDQSSRGNGDFKDIMDYAGITRDELTKLKDGSINSKQFGTGPGAALSWGRTHRFSSAQGEVKHVIPQANNQTTEVYSKPLWLYDSRSYTVKNGSTYQAYIGHSKKIGWFAILKDCANLVTIKTPKPTPTGTIQVTCDAISGFAYDARNLTQKVVVYVYIGGPPGKGERLGPIKANSQKINSPVGKGYGYEVAVPDAYKNSSSPTQIYGVMMPLAGWTESSVQLGTIQLMGGCNPQTEHKPPTASCFSVKPVILQKNKYAFIASATADNGASIKGYTFVVKDGQGNIVSQSRTNSTQLQSKSETIDVDNASKYSVIATVHTSLGDKTSPECERSFDVASSTACSWNANLSAENQDCAPCPGDESLWLNDTSCESHIVQGKTVSNLTQNLTNANNTTANSSDRIEYTIYVENSGLMPAEVDMSEQLGDVLEYSSLIDLGGAQFDSKTKVLSWGKLKLEPNQKQVRKFVVQINNTIAATPQGISEPGSYDCIINNTFGNNTTLKVNCPAVKAVESAVKEFPKTGPGANIAFGATLAMTVTYFYARSRQMSKEVRLIRRDFNAGTI